VIAMSYYILTQTPVGRPNIIVEFDNRHILLSRELAEEYAVVLNDQDKSWFPEPEGPSFEWVVRELKPLEQLPVLAQQTSCSRRTRGSY